IGGMIAVVFMAFLSRPIANFAIKFGSAEMFALMIFAFSATVSITRGSPLKGLISLMLGLMFAIVWQDLQTGVFRFTFGVNALQSGIEFLIIIIGVYALGEVLYNFEKIHIAVKKVQKTFDRIWVSKDQFKRCILPIIRSTPIGFIIGVLPGSGGTIGSLVAYNTEKQINKNGDDFGKGAIEGVAAPEAANNAAATGALIPLLTLGIPGSGTAAVMLGALMMLGLQPGPRLFEEQGNLVWALIASMIIGNLIIAAVNLPFAEILIKILAVPKKILFTLIIGLAFLGTYSFNYNTVDLYILVVFGIIGYLMKKYDVPITPMILASIIGGDTEQNFRRALQVSGGDLWVFFNSNISIILWILAILSASYPFIVSYLQNKKETS
ncbi:MAG: tripartite tricarboxylate transporter permease, partial [Halanaerobiaceae bacterium]